MIHLIKILDNIEKDTTRKIWEKIFTEDTQDFLDYYYKEKTKDNYIFGKFIDNKIVSMLHLNPYSIYINNNISKTYYIVAVATLEEYRKKGYMAELLNNSINFMNKQKIPFTFLRPAKEEIYLPFGFRYIYNHNFLEFNDNISFNEISLTKNNYNFICDFINKYLKQYYNIFSERTVEYIEILHKEVKSENGDISMLYKDNNFIGCYIYWGLNNKIIRAIFSKYDLFKVKENKPLVMARIINLNEFFKNITCKSSQIELIINLEDKIIKENNGIFKLNINNTDSSIIKIDNYNENDILSIDISDLTSLMFGYKNIYEFTNNDNIINLFKDINLYKVFLDEEV